LEDSEMMWLHVPLSELPTEGEPVSGRCRINGQPTDYRVHDGCLDYRHDGEMEWNRRYILAMLDVGNGLAQYVCSEQDVTPEQVEEARSLIATSSDLAGLDPRILARGLRMDRTGKAAEKTHIITDVI
jgi:hypothetical protein